MAQTETHILTPAERRELVERAEQEITKAKTFMRAIAQDRDPTETAMHALALSVHAMIARFALERAAAQLGYLERSCDEANKQLGRGEQPS